MTRKLFTVIDRFTWSLRTYGCFEQNTISDASPRPGNTTEALSEIRALITQARSQSRTSAEKLPSALRLLNSSREPDGVNSQAPPACSSCLVGCHQEQLPRPHGSRHFPSGRFPGVFRACGRLSHFAAFSSGSVVVIIPGSGQSAELLSEIGMPRTDGVTHLRK